VLKETDVVQLMSKGLRCADVWSMEGVSASCCECRMELVVDGRFRDWDVGMIAMRFAWAGPEASAFTSFLLRCELTRKGHYDGE
jgi:hypothetical protein